MHSDEFSDISRQMRGFIVRLYFIIFVCILALASFLLRPEPLGDYQAHGHYQ